ncbi:DUF4249 domain-containing protein [Flammeovirgaceae bacterium SG7u.111]|nr:DUF4249 domain-containing protein [Flammeovirgaceae bacterium SG7u.132]WPO38257.1 DUF4249 domain-containing protein [Flammeovirgaceae bacterium SG7u.111]
MRTSIFILFLVLASCHNSLDINKKDRKEGLVIEGWLDNLNTNDEIQLSFSTDFTSTTNPPVLSDAKVAVVINQQDTLAFEEKTAGVYVPKGRLIGQVGNVYALIIESKEGVIYRSSDEKMQSVAAINTVEVDLEILDPFDVEDVDTTWVINIQFQDPADEVNYYRWILYIDGEQQNAAEDLFVKNDKLTNGLVNTVKIRKKQLKSGSKIIVHQLSLSEDGYGFLEEVRVHMNELGGPFSPAPSSIRGNMFNVDNTAEWVVGYFGASAVSVDSVIVP